MNKAEERKKVIKKLDAKFSLFIRARDSYCVQCGTKERLTCGHLIHRTKHSVRWDEGNCFCQCVGCNFRHESYPHYFTNWYLQKFGASSYDELVTKSNQIHKWTLDELTQLLDHYTSLTRTLG